MAVPMKNDIRAVTVPGAIDGWLALHERHGRLDLDTVFASAIRFAENGFPVHPTLSATLHLVVAVEHADLPAAAPAGAIITRPGSARALRAIARDGRAGFYEGEFGEGLLAAGPDEFVPADLATVQARWVEPIKVDAFGHQIWSVPPTSQGTSPCCPQRLRTGSSLTTTVSARMSSSRRRSRPGTTGRPNSSTEPTRFGSSMPSALRIDGPRSISDGRRGRHPQLRRRHDVSVRDRRQRHGGVAHQLQRQRFRRAPRRRFERHLLHDRGLGFSLQAGHPAEYRPGKRPPHTWHRRSSPTPTAVCAPCSARWAATLSLRSSCRCWRSHSATVAVPARWSVEGVGVSPLPSTPASRHGRRASAARSSWRTTSLRRSSTHSLPAGTNLARPSTPSSAMPI